MNELEGEHKAYYLAVASSHKEKRLLLWKRFSIFNRIQRSIRHSVSAQILRLSDVCRLFSSLPSRFVAPGALACRQETVFPNPLPPEVETARWSCRRNHRLKGTRWWCSAGRTTKWGAQQDHILADMSRSPVTIYKKLLSYAFVNLNKSPYNYARSRLHIQRPQNNY